MRRVLILPAILILAVAGYLIRPRVKTLLEHVRSLLHASTMPLAVCEGRYCHGIQTPPGASPQALLQPVAEFPILGVPNHGERLTIWADRRDSFGSVIQCMEMVHAANQPKTLDAGYCELPPHSLHAGITTRLTRLYPDVYVKLRQ